MKKQPQHYSAWHINFWLINLRKAAGQIGGSFWFIPSLLITIAVIAGILLPQIPLPTFITSILERVFYNVNLENSLDVIKLIASSTITITSIAFSMTVVALVMASNQFGPRLIENFMHNKLTQSVLGVFTSTFVFCLVVVSKINLGSETTFYPALAMLVAVILAIICVFVLIFFIHHVAMSIRADTVVKQIAASLMTDIHALQCEKQRTQQFKSFLELDDYTHKLTINSQCDGYIQAIEFQQILGIAKQFNGLIVMQRRSGQYVVPGTPIATIYNNESLPKLISVDSALVIGQERTSLQDPLFAINQLVEMALRALSPSLNDPFTATNCIDRLASAMASFTTDNLPKTSILDEQNELRIVTNDATFSDLFKGAFTQIRQNSAAHTFVVMHLLDTFIILINACNSGAHICEAVATQVKAIKQYHLENNVFSNQVDKMQYNERIATLDALIDNGPC